MGFRTWTIKAAGREFHVKAAKDDAENVSNEIHRLVNIRQSWRELSGVKGESEHTSVLTALFSVGKGTLADEAGYAADLAAFFSSLPDVIVDCKAVRLQARALFDKHLPIVDNRKTQNEQAVIEAERNAEHAKHEAERAAKDRAFLDMFSDGGESIPLPDGMMAIYAEVTFDDSDIQSDYFDSTRQHGKDLLLAIVPKQAQTERLFRAAVAKYPELAATEFTWHTENYSMGRGNYLLGDWFQRDGLEAKPTYQSSGKHFRYMIRAGCGQYFGPFYPFKGYPGNGPQAAEPTAPMNGVTVRRNLEHDGIEITFPGKPDQSVIDTLKVRGFRWSFRNRVWYHKFTPALLEWANWQFAQKSDQPQAEPEPAQTTARFIDGMPVPSDYQERLNAIAKDACRAEELFTLDELEAHAAKLAAPVSVMAGDSDDYGPITC